MQSAWIEVTWLPINCCYSFGCLSQDYWSFQASECADPTCIHSFPCSHGSLWLGAELVQTWKKTATNLVKAGVDALDYLYFQQFSFKESSSFVQSRLKWRLLISGKIKRTEQVKRIVHWGGYFCFNNVLLQQLKLKSKQAWALRFIMVKASTVPLGSSQLASFVFNSYCPVESDNMAHNE